jgi:hypothetical protein
MVCLRRGSENKKFRNTAIAARPAPEEAMAKIVSLEKRVDAGIKTSGGNQPCEADGRLARERDHYFAKIVKIEMSGSQRSGNRSRL